MALYQTEDLRVLREAIEKIDVGLAAWDENWILLTGNALGRRLAGSIHRAEMRARLREDETTTLVVSSGESRFRAQVRRARTAEGGSLLVAWFHPVDEAAAWSDRLGLKYRERQILALVLSGLRNREIGSRLGIAEGTVKQYLNRIFGALEVRSRAELILRLSHAQQP